MKERGCGKGGGESGEAKEKAFSRENVTTKLRPCYDRWRRCEDPVTTGNDNFYDRLATLLMTSRLEVTTN